MLYFTTLSRKQKVKTEFCEYIILWFPFSFLYGTQKRFLRGKIAAFRIAFYERPVIKADKLKKQTDQGLRDRKRKEKLRCQHGSDSRCLTEQKQPA